MSYKPGQDPPMLPTPPIFNPLYNGLSNTCPIAVNWSLPFRSHPRLRHGKWLINLHGPFLTSSRENAVTLRNPSPPGGADAVQELLQMLTATKESQEIERKRRLAWEQEQEAKYTQRHAGMERQILEMRQEIVSLKASMGLNPNGSPAMTGSHVSGNGAPIVVQQPTPLTSLSPVSTSSQSHIRPAFVEGSSSRPLRQQSIPTDVQTHSPESMIIDSPSPQFVAVEGSRLHSYAPSPNPRKRPTPGAETDEDEGSSESGSDESPPQRSLRRVNGHDSRCLTIQVCFNLFVIY